MASTSLLLLFLAFGQSAADERALAVESSMVEAMGGRDNWDRARFFRFTFVRGNRKPEFIWDRWTGRLRLESRDDSGVPFVVLMNVKTRQGKAFLDGNPLSGKELSDYLNLGYRMWKGETYWLLMPFKWRDEGVKLEYEGEERIDGALYDVVRLSFDDGRSPGDVYWAYVNRESHLMDRWRFALHGGFEGEFRWSGWEQKGGILLATQRVGESGTIRFEDVYVGPTMPDSAFASPEPVSFPR